MIPLYKLERLPRIQKLRKIAKVFTFADNRLSQHIEKIKKSLKYKTEIDEPLKTDIFTAAEFAFFAEAACMLAKDAQFSRDAVKAFKEAADVFRAALHITETASAEDALGLRRAINRVKHILLAETGRDQADWDFTCGDGSLDPAVRQIFKGVWVYLEDIRSPFNVGAIFRTAESFGVEKIILSPFCADPRHKRAQRTAMGCIEAVPWERQDLFSAAEAPPLPCPVFALETGGIPITEFPFPRNGLLIAGSEELGVSPRALAAADASLGRVSIPCYGAKASLNVSVAFGIAMNAWASAARAAG